MSNLKKQKIPFTQVANEVLNNPALSWKAKGLFAYLFGKPDTWNFESERIANDSSDGRDSTRNGIKELERFGYLKRIKLSNRRMEYQLKYDVEPMTEKPSLTPTDNQSLSVTENANDGKSHSGKTRPISNKDSDSNKESNSNTNPDGQAVVKVMDMFRTVNPAIIRMYGNKTQRQAVLNLVKEFTLPVVLRATTAAIGVLNQPYAPKITTPYQLETDWTKLVAFLKQHQAKTTNKVFTV